MTKKNALSGLFLISSTVPLSAEGGIHAIPLVDIEGNSTSLEAYRGKALLIVNVASKCGFTYQYEGLEALYQKYKDDGLAVLGFPSNDFLGQEPGTEAEIQTFCSTKYQVTFPLFSKIPVKGRSMHPLYKYLTSKQTNPKFSGRITWNFNKFLISGTGEIINRFGSKDEPESPAVVTAIEEALAAVQ